jgi:hypothetical protein
MSILFAGFFGGLNARGIQGWAVFTGRVSTGMG